MIALFSALLVIATLISSGDGTSVCNGMVCPDGTSCSVMSNMVGGMQLTEAKCYDYNGDLVQQQTIGGQHSTSQRIFNDNGKTCIISENIVNGQPNLSKMCRDGNGEFRPMTPQEESYFDMKTKVANEEAKKSYEAAMKQAAATNEYVNKLTSDIAQRQQQWADNFSKQMEAFSARMQNFGFGGFGGFGGLKRNQRAQDRVMEAMERRLEREERERERLQDEYERRMEQHLDSMDFSNNIDSLGW